MIFAFEIIMKMFLQNLDEEGKSERLPLEYVTLNYIRSDFLTDLIAFLPLGGIFSSFDERLKFLWLVKALRIKDLH